jgi:hypothetical protein
MQSAEDVLHDDLTAGGLRREHCQTSGRGLRQAIDANAISEIRKTYCSARRQWLSSDHSKIPKPPPISGKRIATHIGMD